MVELKQATLKIEALEASIHHEVTQALAKRERAVMLVRAFEERMLEQAETALDVAEKSYRAGAISFLEILEAQRTHLETQANYLSSQYDARQALVDVAYAVGAEPP